MPESREHNKTLIFSVKEIFKIVKKEMEFSPELLVILCMLGMIIAIIISL